MALPARTRLPTQRNSLHSGAAETTMLGRKRAGWRGGDDSEAAAESEATVAALTRWMTQPLGSCEKPAGVFPK